MAKSEKDTFNSEMVKFVTSVSYIVGLEGNGKLSSEEAYKKIKSHWKELKTNKKALLSKED